MSIDSLKLITQCFLKFIIDVQKSLIPPRTADNRGMTVSNNNRNINLWKSKKYYYYRKIKFVCFVVHKYTEILLIMKMLISKITAGLSFEYYFFISMVSLRIPTAVQPITGNEGLKYQASDG